MKKIKIVMISAFFACVIVACEKTGKGESRVEKCYERITSGSGITDQLTLNVEFIADSVSGELNWLPQEKDSQRGMIRGIKDE